MRFLTNRSNKKVKVDTWHKLVVERRGIYGTLQLNDGDKIEGQALGNATELNLHMPVYIGGFK